jgi:hypothetical protein
MVRTLMVSMVMSLTAIAGACPTCGCTEAKTENASATQACATACTEAAACEKACETPCDGATATVTQVAAKGEDCAASCTGAAVMAVANDTCDSACDKACDTACETECETGKTAQVAFASWMPKMTYKVGDQTMTCSKMAGAKATEQHTHMHYVVNGVEFDSHEKAMTAHAQQLQGMMMDLVRVQFAVDGECVACPDSAKAMADSCESKKLQYRVGPATFDNAEDAIKASIMAYNAAMNVKMEYAVGEQVTACSTSAGEMAKANNCSVEYVVNGQRTGCKTSAGYMKTLVSVQNALKALEAASKANADA